MITSIVCIALIGTLQFNSAISAATNYEPIKITVNENFNAQPGHVSPKSQEPGVVHQGANFYFKPQLNLPPSYIPSHTEGLKSLIQQHLNFCSKDASKLVVEKDELKEILQPFMYPMSEISKETLPEIFLEKENNLEIVKPIVITDELKPVTPGFLVIPEALKRPLLSFNGIPPTFEKKVKKEESVILEESPGVFPTIAKIAMRPITEPIINYVQPKPITSGLVVIPEAPVLRPLSANDIHVIEEEVKIEEPTVVEVEPKPAIQELVTIPEAPVLLSLSLHDISSIIEEEAKKEESVIFEDQVGVFSMIPEIHVRPIEEPIINYVEPKLITSELVGIPKAPVLPSLSFNGIPPIIEEEVKKEESIILEESLGVLPEPTIIEVEPKPIISELLVIPEAPVLPPLSFNGIHPIVEEEVKKEESIILEEATGVFPTIPEIAVRPITEPIINYVEPTPIISELLVIPEAPVLPPLSFNGIHPIVEEEVKKEESIILEEATGVFPTIPEIAVRPITEPFINYVEPTPINEELVVIPEAPMLPPLSANDIHVVEEVVKIEEPIVVDVEPKPVIQELVPISEAPVLPSLSIHDISSMIEEEVKEEESVIFEDQVGVFSTISEIDERPIEEPIINYVEPKPITSELVVLPEAQVLPPLSFNGIPPIVEEEVEKEESIILEAPTDVFPTISEIAVRPISEMIINYVEPTPINAELVVIPEAPMLPPLSANDIHVVEEEVKIEEPIVVDVEPKPVIQELVAISEAPVLPSLSLHDISSMIEEEVKKEELVIFEKLTRMFPSIPEIDVRPIEEPIINYIEPKPITSELVVIPEAPVLPPLSFNGIPRILEEEVKKEESIILEAPTDVFPTIPEINVRPIEEPIIYYVEPKLITSEAVVIPEAPVLPQLSYNGIPPVIEDVKIEESIKFEESTGVFPSISEISARPCPEPLVVSETAESFASENKILPIATEELKIEVPILFKESIEVFPPTAEIYSGPTLQESEITDSYVLKEVSQPNPESLVTIKERLPPTIISKPSNNMGEFNYEPFVSHLSNRAPKTKQLMIPKLPSVERFLHKKHPFRLPVTTLPKHNLNAIKSSLGKNKKQFIRPTSYAHDVVEKRIVPNMPFKQQNASKRVKMYIPSNVPKRPSYL